MVMDMDGKTVRVDSVDFPNEEVRLTDLTDKQHPVQFWEKPSIVRDYVEDAPAENLWKAIDRREHGSWKKSSVLAKLKEHAKSVPDKAANSLNTQETERNGEMIMKFTVEEINLMCCFDTSSRKRLIAEMKSLPIDELDDEMAELLFHTVRKLEGITDEAFAQLYIAPDSMIDD